MTILWLDDMRDPVSYLKKNPDNGSETLRRNLQFYNSLLKKYNPSFKWVKNFDEFTSYIEQNGLPDMVSFDHDLGKGLKKGAECAAWLKSYCEENGLPLPKIYAHSANPNGRREINSIFNINNETIQLNSEDIREMVEAALRLITEDVFADKSKLNSKKKVVGLTYSTHGKRNPGNLKSNDMLGTDKMDEDNEDTYIVKLKGNIDSYNITSIKGESVMHYFKNKFAKNGLPAKVKAGGDEYELMMEDNEFRKFCDVFNSKVNRVINYCIKNFRQENDGFEPNKVTIYPVPSSVNFNKNMAEIMSHMQLGGLPVRVANTDMLKKDLRNLKKDEDFIKKNAKYYSSPMSNVPDNGYDNPVINFLDKDINRMGAIRAAEKYINEMNAAVEKLLSAWQRYKMYGSDKTLRAMAELYKRYYDAMRSCTARVDYTNPVKGDSEKSTLTMDTVAKALKYTKGPSVAGRSDEIWDFVKPLLRGVKSPITGKPYKREEINRWEPQKFQIKKISNGERMGLMNYFSPNEEDAEMVKQELEALKGGVFVIFDDNISGGATLSDICYQCKQMGINYLIPITFGKMNTKWTMGVIPLNQPEGENGKRGEFLY